MASTLRTSDTAAEKEVAKFLDSHFYPKHVQHFTRYNDFATQLKGIDVQFDYKDLKTMLVDEKASSHYVNKDIPTFAFEVDFFTAADELAEGWLFDESKQTRFYLLAWLWASKDKDFIADEITKVELLIVERKAIIEMLASYAVTKEVAGRYSRKIRNEKLINASYQSKERPFYFYYSEQLAEKPLNIIIKKRELVRLAIGRHVVKT